MTFPRPLENFPLVRAADAAEVCDTFGRVYAKPVVKGAPDGARSMAINHMRLKHVRLAFGAVGAPLSLEFPGADYFLQILPLRGEGEIVSPEYSLVVSAGQGATISPGVGFQAIYRPGYETLILQIDKDALTDKLVTMTGTPVAAPLRVEPRLDLARPAAKILQQYVPMLVDTLGSAALPLPSWWVAQTEELLMAMFLCGHKHNYSHVLEEAETGPADAQIRRVETYIEAHWQEDISLETLAEVAGVSAFSLFRVFKKLRGYSPLDFAARIRARRDGQSR